MGDFELSSASAPDYLRARGAVAFGTPVVGRELGGGVSNMVVLVEAGADRFVLKQALPQLRVADEWFADQSRIFRERDGMADAAKLLPAGWVPEVLFSDDAEHLFAMEALPAEAQDWKSRLMRGVVERTFARRAGIALGLTVRGSRGSESFAYKYADSTAFDQLRTDPYYRTIGQRHPDLAQAAEDWIGEVAGRKQALVHGDWSPKNMMVVGERMVFIDYECAHYGDPAFDAAFCINHFLLKAFHRPYQKDEYLGLARVFFTWILAVLPAPALADFEQATARHLSWLLLARVDGKSPAEYIVDESLRDTIRGTAKRLIEERPAGIEAHLGAVEEAAGRS